MDAYSTLIWNRMVRARFSSWLASPRFVMAELVYKKHLPAHPITPEFNDDGEYVDVNILTAQSNGNGKSSLPLPSGGRERVLQTE